MHSRGELPVTLRPLEAADHAGLVALYRACFAPAAARPLDEVERKLHQLFVDGPLCGSRQPSLVAADESGALVGFHGVLTRRWRLGDELLLGRCGTHNMVHPKARRMGVFAKLNLRQREQRNALGESWVGFADRGTDDSRSFHDGWNNPSGQYTRLEQFGFRWEIARRGRLHEALRGLRSRPDGRQPGSTVALRSRPLDAASLADAFEALGADFPLRLDEPGETWQWLVDYLDDYPSRGHFHGAVLCSAGRDPVGFYCGYLSPRGLDVVALGALREQLEDVVAQLLRDAASLSVRAVSGWASAAELRTILAAGAVVGAGTRAGIATTREDVRQHFQAMDALVTGLEGERWI